MKTSEQNRQPERAASSVQEFARRYGIARNTVYAAIRDGSIPAVRIRARIVIPRESEAEWLRGARRAS